MAQNERLQATLQKGIELARAGDNAGARAQLEIVLRADPNNELAWIWMASVVPGARERRACLERVLRINPNNNRAREALNALIGVGAGGDFNAERIQGGVAEVNQPVSLTDRLLNSLTGILVGVAVLVVIGVGLTLLSPPPATIVSATQVPSATPILYTNTPSLTPTFPGVQISMEDRLQSTLPPTFTPTATETPEPTLIPSATPPAPSDFSLLFVARAEEAPQGDLQQMQGDGSGIVPLLADVRDAVYSADGRFVFFVRDVVYGADEDGTGEQINSEIFVAPADNLNDARQLTELRTSDAYQPAPSPDGGQVVFVSAYDAENDDDLYLLDIASNSIVLLANTPYVEREPHWSPDGRYLVFTSDRESPGFLELYLYDFAVPQDRAEEEAVTRLTNSSGSSYGARWSPDGSQIVFVNDRTGIGDIYLTNPQGTRTILLMGTSTSDDRHPIWSPDGRNIAFISNRQDERFQIYLTDIRGQTITRLQNDDFNTIAIDFRPDARFLRQAR